MLPSPYVGYAAEAVSQVLGRSEFLLQTYLMRADELSNHCTPDCSRRFLDTEKLHPGYSERPLTKMAIHPIGPFDPFKATAAVSQFGARASAVRCLLGYSIGPNGLLFDKEPGATIRNQSFYTLRYIECVISLIAIAALTCESLHNRVSK